MARRPIRLAAAGRVMASGLEPLATAVRQWCAPAERCHFGVTTGSFAHRSGASPGAAR